MRLQRAINILDITQALFAFFCLIGIVLASSSLRGGKLVIAIILLLSLLPLAYVFNLGLTKYFLKHCKHPIELLSVLDQLGLIPTVKPRQSGIFINVPDKAKLLTHQFLADNRLKTKIISRDKYFSSSLLLFTVNGLVFNEKNYEWTIFKVGNTNRILNIIAVE